MAEANQPIVIDNGTGVMKAGFAGGDKPRCIFRSCVGRVKHTRVMPGGPLDGSDYFIGSKVDEHRGALSLSYPMENGNITNWADMEKIWTYIYSKEQLNVPFEEHTVLLTQPPFTSIKQQETIQQIFFEGFNTPGLYTSLQAILSLYASGRTTGLVIDCGEGQTQIVPVYEGLTIPHGIIRLNYGGSSITNHLKYLLAKNYSLNFYNTNEMEIVREMKESLCQVSMFPGSSGSFDTTSSSPTTSHETKQQYKLPDGTVLTLSQNILNQACEVLFSPSILGYDDGNNSLINSLLLSIKKCDIELRKNFYSNILLSGGTTLLPGLPQRLLYELRQSNSFNSLSSFGANSERKYRILAPPERMYTTWIGGSILSSLSTFKNMWVTKSDYEEHGARLLINKSL